MACDLAINVRRPSITHPMKDHLFSLHVKANMDALFHFHVSGIFFGKGKFTRSKIFQSK